MPSDLTNEATRQEWRKLGFYYDRDDEKKAWRFTGSLAGLLHFRDALLAHIADPRNAALSEHEHYGPYAYLKVMTWPEGGIDEHAIRGSLADLGRLAKLIANRLSTSSPGSVIRIREEFAANSSYSLVIELREDGFDPAAADPLLPP